jgi:hypothetical protein
LIVDIPLPPLPLPALLQCQEMDELRSTLSNVNYRVTEYDIISWCNDLSGKHPSVLRRIPTLEHRLSDVFERRLYRKEVIARTPGEIRALKRFCEFGAPHEYVDWEKWIININSAVTNANSSFRENSIYTERDKYGGYATYPNFGFITEAMKHMNSYKNRYIIDYPLETSIVSLVFLGAIHPFADGNGRTSRVVFNTIAGSIKSKTYIPLYELSEHSRGGYILALREAQYNNKWRPIIRFLSEGCKVLEELVFRDRAR